MWRSWLSVVVAILLASGLSGVSCAEDGSWKMPNLNPFSSKSGPARGSVSDTPTSGWKMPKMWPSTGKTAASSRAKKRQANQPSTLSKMSTGTQQFFSKTADALNPWDDKPAEAPKLTGSNSMFSRSVNKSKKSDVAPASWWGGESAKQNPKSVNDFLSQPRP